MKLFKCDRRQCAGVLENVTCLNCGHALGFDPDICAVVTSCRWLILRADLPSAAIVCAGLPTTARTPCTVA